MEQEAATRDAVPVDVSVVVPAYRAAEFVGRAIDSALGQTGVSVEVVVVDDACPEGTGDAVERQYADRNEVRVLRQPHNQGPSAARNAGIDAARGTWVAVLDADDAYEPGRLAHLVRSGVQHDADVVADNVRFLDVATGERSEPRLRSVTGPTLLDVHALAAGGRPGTGELDLGLLKPCYRRDFLDRSALRYPEDVRHGEDFLYYVALVQAGARFLVLPEAGYLWTLRSSGHSRTHVDYLSQVTDTRRLQRSESVREDERLVALLDERAAALVRLHQAQTYAEALREGRYARALATCLRHPHLVRYVSASVRKRVRPQHERARTA